MKYKKEERMEIGRRIYEGEMSRFEAAAAYGIAPDTARDYMRMFRAEHRLPAKNEGTGDAPQPMAVPAEFAAMSREELILELMRIRGGA